MVPLPTGTVTFLFTDVEGSTRRWEEQPDVMRASLARHDAILRAAVERNRGVVIKGTGDGIHAAFAAPDSALAAAIDAQRGLHSESWADGEPLRARMGIHVGSAELRDGDYFGSAVNRAARLMQVAHGGQIVVSGAVEELTRGAWPTDASLRSLGTHRLRDLSEADRVFQVDVADLPRDFPPLRSVDSFASNLPYPVTTFVGRAAELAELAKLLTEARVVTLTGVGGVGKTRLAIHLAAELLPRFSDGAWLCELGPVSDASAVAEVVAAALSIQPRAGSTAVDTVVDGLRYREALLVLDNCEHVIAAAAHLVEAIVRSCAGVRVLATSREGLGIAGERLILVRSLAVPDDASTTDNLRDSDAVQLFLDRATASRHGFTLSEENADAIGQICRRLDGIPLAIELAAARVRMMSPTEIRDRLDERFRLLTGGSRTAVERHQTLRSAVDWSYDLLDPSQQRLLDRLGVFAGDFTLDAAEAIAEPAGSTEESMLDQLGQLVDKSLVIAEEDTDGETRYRLLETIRQYAVAHLDDAGTTDAIRRLHAQWCVRFVIDATARSHGPDEVAWNRRVIRELDNLRAAAIWTTGASDTDLAMDLLGRFELAYVPNSPVLFALGPWAAAALATPGALDHPTAGVVLSLRAADHLVHGRVDDAERDALEALDLVRRPDRDYSPYPWGVLLRAYALTGRGGEMIERGDEFIAWTRELGDDFDLSFALSLAAISHMVMDRSGEGVAYAEEGLRIAERIGAPGAIALATSALSMTLAEQDPPRALAMAERSLENSLELGHGLNVMTSLGAIGRVGRGAEDPRWAALFLAMLEYTFEAGDLRLTDAQLDTYAQALAQIDRFEPAAVLLGSVQRDGYANNPISVTRHAALRDLLATAIGDARVGVLLVEGRAMDTAGAVAFARTELQRVIDGER